MKKKLLALLLCSAMAASVLAGCGAEETPAASDEAPEVSDEAPAASDEAPAADADAIDISEHVDLTMYLVGDIPETYDDITAKLNEILERELNCSMTIEWLSWAEHPTQYSLLFSGGEDFDLIFTATSWCHFEQTTALGGFYGMDEEFIQTYAPDIWEQMPDVAWSQATVDGLVYMVPANFVEVNPEALAIRGDLLAKYGYEDMNNWDDLIAFFKQCAADGTYASTVGQTNLLYTWQAANARANLSGTPSSGELIVFDGLNAANPAEISYLLDMPEFTEFCHLMKEMADLGCWPADVLGTTEDRQTGLVTGRAATMGWNTGTCQIYANEANAAHPEWKINVYNLQPEGTYSSTKYINGGMGINAASENKERAMMALNLMASSKEIMDLTSLGIEGVNWEAVGEDQYKELTPYTPSNWWGWRNTNLMRSKYDENATEVDIKVKELNEYYLENIRAEHALDGFNFDATKVSSQFAAVEAAMGTYWYPLLNGFVDDVDATIAEFKAALDTAGMQDILTEVQAQVDAFVAAQ